MMCNFNGYCVFIGCVVSILRVQCDVISPKLDFEKEDENVARYVVKSPGNDDNDAVTTVVCINEGCNKTQEIKNDELLTDIIVHLKTSQKGVRSNKTIVQDTPDVPIVVGSSTSPSNTLSGNLLNSNVAPNYKGNENLFIPSLPTFNKQHYGEQAPQHLVWYPKGGVSYNPVEFKRFETPTWRRVQYPQQFQHRVTPGYTTCMCRNPGLNWYPTTPAFNYHYRKNDGIDDKLGELN